MLNTKTSFTTKEKKLYNSILVLSRNKLFYTTFNLCDTFQNRIYLIFIHISFLFLKNNPINKNPKYKNFCQKMFDLVFYNIELNMREIGYGDVSVNKNMKLLVKSFYNILIECENFNLKSSKLKNSFLFTYLIENNKSKNPYNLALINYFTKYKNFCYDLNSDSVLSGELNFNFK